MRAYRLLLRLYPASFRHEYGDEMTAIFARRLRDASNPLTRAALWVPAIAEVAANAALVAFAVIAFLLAVGALAVVMTVAGTLMPTLRALRVDPIKAIRTE